MKKLIILLIVSSMFISCAAKSGAAMGCSAKSCATKCGTAMGCSAKSNVTKACCKNKTTKNTKQSSTKEAIIGDSKASDANMPIILEDSNNIQPEKEEDNDKESDNK